MGFHTDAMSDDVMICHSLGGRGGGGGGNSGSPSEGRRGKGYVSCAGYLGYYDWNRSIGNKTVQVDSTVPSSALLQPW